MLRTPKNSDGRRRGDPGRLRIEFRADDVTAVCGIQVSPEEMMGW